ncbi:TetR/AcrR family transcriptional regulator [Nocardia miyunensis]|uniref:TetR/AcrR family transcriptional regulator n=1 Tax=Nocardia miyunensis TaxID=282684 RepID=UPI00083273A6|nr:TetR/AcrR family transcriptional regulator [Nocardia miyunensis]
MVTSTPRRRHRDTLRKGELREKAILDTAESLLADPGPDAMTVEDIARGAGISRGSLYFYFGSKNEVLTALVARTLEQLRSTALVPTADTDLPPREAIAMAVTGTESMWREHGSVMRTAVEYSAIVPEIGDLWASAIATSRDALTLILVRAGLPDGPGPADAPALAQALCWMSERTFYRTIVESPDQLPATARTCTEIWYRVIPDSDT